MSTHKPKEDNKIQDIIDEVNKKYGNNSIITLDDGKIFDVEFNPTELLGIRYIFGCGGLPKGRVVTFQGRESSGKSALAYHLIGCVQRNGGTAALVDAENSFTSERAGVLGIDQKKLLISTPASGEEAIDITDKLAKAGIDIIVLDSSAALTPLEELEGEIEDRGMCLQARLITKGLRKINSTLTNSKSTVVFINQLRDSMNPYGPKTTATGGNALKFFSAVNIETKKIENIEGDEKNVVGMRIGFHVTKNKVGPCYRRAEVDFLYDTGFNESGNLLDWGEKLNIIERSGSTYSYDGEKIAVGKNNSREALKSNIELTNKIKDNIIKIEKIK